MTLSEHNHLQALLGKQLREALTNRRDAIALHSGTLLYLLGGQVYLDGDDTFTVTHKDR